MGTHPSSLLLLLMLETDIINLLADLTHIVPLLHVTYLTREIYTQY